ncbi:MAG: hypothetical protein IPK23_06705 [Rhizobiales bacterium]|nr:hypothetical protein [Hyphomicrobiales bacterium]
MYRSFITRVLSTALLVFLIPLALSEFLRGRFSEFEAADIAAIQAKSPDALYLSGLDQDVSGYKLELTKLRRPDIVVIGSSRAMQVRSEFLNGTLVNWGGVARTIGQLHWAAQEIVELKNKPKVALVFLDPWWFNERYLDGRDIFVLREQRVGNVFRTTYVLGNRALRHGIATRPDRLGMAAIQSNQGYDGDGTFHYLARVTGVEKTEDVNFRRTLRMIGAQEDRFVGSDEPNPYAIKRWHEIRALLEKNGIKVVAIVAPMAPSAIDLMRKNGKHTLYFALARMLGSDIADFIDPTAFAGADNCEFLDGFHGGEVSYARMLVTLAQQRPDISSAINTDFLRGFVKENSGLTSPITIKKYGGGKHEVDFGGHGCKR